MNQKPSPLHRASEWIVDHYRLFFVVFAALLVFSAVASGWVKVENDVAAYLPADSETRQGLDIMEQEFQTYGSAKILLRDTDADAAAATAEQIHAVDGVDSCTYTMNDTGSALLSVSLSDLEGSDTCAQTVQALRDLLDGSGAYIYSAEGYSISDQINGEVRGLLVIVAIILVTVLTFTSSTYAEVPILLITFLAAALINKGTNFVFGTISFVSNAVAILLQLAMSVDYAIIFCNRYKQAHETLPVREAVIESLEKSITVISSSSLTTIAGLVAMTFMKFGLGRDLGIVLIKAILISMLTVFLLMPGLLLKLGPAMDKTKHRNFVPKISGVGRLAWRTRRVVPLVFAAVLVVACIGANRVSYVYSEAPLKTHNADANRTASQAITDDFGDETVLAVVVPAGDYTQEAALLDALSALPEVKSAVGIAGTEAAGGYRLADAVDYRTFAQLSDVDSTSAQALFALYAAENGAAQTAAQDLSVYQVPLLKLFKFLNDKIADGTVTLSAAQAAQVTALSSQLERASAQLEGTSYHRLVLTLAAASDGDETFALLDRIHAVVHQYYPTDSYLVGDAMSAYGSEQTFTQDNVMVSAMSILMVMLVLLFTFRSLGMPILLTLVIQGSIWINFGITVLTGEYVLFMVYLVASAIQMGCNVDYAIVVASHYTEARADQGPREAMITALNLAFPTIITSGTMLISAGLLIGARVSSGAVAGMGRFVGVGSLITVFLVLFVLPQLLLLGDIRNHGLVDLHHRRRGVGNPRHRFAADRVVEGRTHVGRRPVVILAVEKFEGQIVQRRIGAGAGAQVGYGGLGQIIEHPVLVALPLGDMRHRIVDEGEILVAQVFGRQRFEQLQSLVVATRFAEPRGGHAHTGLVAATRHRELPDMGKRIAPRPLLKGIRGFVVAARSHRTVARMPSPVFAGRHAGRIDLPEKLLGQTDLPPSQPDVNVAQQGEAAHVPRPGPLGQPVEPFDIIGRRIEVESHVNLGDGKEPFGTLQGRQAVVDPAAQRVGLLLPPLLVAGLVGEFRVEPFQCRLGLQRILRAVGTPRQESARQHGPQESEGEKKVPRLHRRNFGLNKIKTNARHYKLSKLFYSAVRKIRGPGNLRSYHRNSPRGGFRNGRKTESEPDRPAHFLS